MRLFRDYLDEKRARHGDQFSPAGLSSQFIPYFENQKRIEVDMGAFGIQRGRVGVTTGWQPSFLLMRRRSDIGSMYLLSDRDKILRTIPDRKR